MAGAHFSSSQKYLPLSEAMAKRHMESLHKHDVADNQIADPTNEQLAEDQLSPEELVQEYKDIYCFVALVDRQ